VRDLKLTLVALVRAAVASVRLTPGLRRTTAVRHDDKPYGVDRNALPNAGARPAVLLILSAV
jgi:hypothetical protein